MMVAEVCVVRDVWSVLRRLALHDFEKARAGGAAVGPDDGRAQPIHELARTLRLLLADADVAGAAGTSHVGLLLQQLIDLSFGVTISASPPPPRSSAASRRRRRCGKRGGVRGGGDGRWGRWMAGNSTSGTSDAVERPPISAAPPDRRRRPLRGGGASLCRPCVG